MKTISVINQKGGVGKTTTAAAFASVLISNKKRVLVIDMDAQCNLSNYYGIHTTNDLITTYDILADKNTSIKDSIIVSEQGDIIPSSSFLATVDGLLLNEIDRHSRLRKALKYLNDEYDYIIIDTPPALSTLTINALCASDYVIIPSSADSFSMQGIVQVMNTITAVQENLNEKLEVAGILITMFQRSIGAQKAMAQYIKELGSDLGIYTFEQTIRATTTVREAQIQSKSLVEYAKYKDVTYDYRKAVEEFEKIINERSN